MKKAVKIIIAVLSLAVIFSGCSKGQEGVNITVSKVKTGSLISETTYSSTLEAAETMDVFSNTSGKVTKVNAAVGDFVNKGDVLFTIDDRDAQLQARQAQVSASEASITPLQVAYDEAVKNYEREQVLFQSGMVSKVEFDVAAAKKETAEAQLNNAKAGAQVALDMANKKLSDTVVTAPMAGQVASKTVKAGSVASTQVSAMTLINSGKMKVTIHVTEKMIGLVSDNMAAKVVLQSTGETFQGIVTTISPGANTKTGLFDVEITMDNAAKKLKPGMLASVALQGSGEAAQIMVPKQSVIKENGKAYVYAVSGGQLKKIEVTTGREVNAYIEILSGLNKTDEIVVQGSDKVKEGSKFNIVSADY